MNLFSKIVTGLICEDCDLIYPTTLSKATCGRCDKLMTDEQYVQWAFFIILCHYLDQDWIKREGGMWRSMTEEEIDNL